MLNLGLVHTALSFQQRKSCSGQQQIRNIKGLSSLELNEIDFQRDAYISIKNDLTIVARSLTYLLSQELTSGKPIDSTWYLNTLKASCKFSIIINLQATDKSPSSEIFSSSYFAISSHTDTSNILTHQNFITTLRSSCMNMVLHI